VERDVVVSDTFAERRDLHAVGFLGVSTHQAAVRPGGGLGMEIDECGAPGAAARFRPKAERVLYELGSVQVNIR
jgi:hypothetical protein